MPDPIPACPTCKGCGAVLPTPFHVESEPRTAWVDHLAAETARCQPFGPWPRTSSATFNGPIRPVKCPDCDGTRTGVWASPENDALFEPFPRADLPAGPAPYTGRIRPVPSPDDRAVSVPFTLTEIPDASHQPPPRSRRRRA